MQLKTPLPPQYVRRDEAARPPSRTIVAKQCRTGAPSQASSSLASTSSRAFPSRTSKPRRPRSPQVVDQDLDDLFAAQCSPQWTSVPPKITVCAPKGTCTVIDSKASEEDGNATPLPGISKTSDAVRESPSALEYIGTKTLGSFAGSPLPMELVEKCWDEFPTLTGGDHKARQLRGTPKLTEDIRHLSRALASARKQDVCVESKTPSTPSKPRRPFLRAHSRDSQSPTMGISSSTMKKRVLAQFFVAGLRPPTSNDLLSTQPTAVEAPPEEGSNSDHEDGIEMKREATEGTHDMHRLSSINFLKNCLKPMQDKAEENGKTSAMTAAEITELARRLTDGNETASLSKLALSMKIPLDVIKQAWDLFERFAQLPEKVKRGKDRVSTQGPRPSGMSVLTGAGLSQKDATSVVMKAGQLTSQTFADMLCKLSNVEDAGALPDGLLYSCFTLADSNGSGSLDFQEFALWYSTCGFREDLLCSEEQIELRAIAKRQDIDMYEIEKYKKEFEVWDLDKTGLIEYEEFVQLLVSLLKIPSHLDIPASRVKQFWFEADSDSSGSINFEEFLSFYRKYFSTLDRGQKTCPIEDFYRGVRMSYVEHARGTG